MRSLTLLSAVLLLAGCATVRPTGIEPIDPPESGFYAKRLWSGGIPIKAHATVSDEALFAARERLERLLGQAPKLRANLEAGRRELHLIGLRQFTSELPEFKDDRGTRLDSGELFDWHMIGGHISGRFSSCTEGTLLPIVGHRLFGDEVCMHELGHAVQMALANRVWGQVLALHKSALEAERWKGEYAAKNAAEYFAELTKYYFRPDGDALAFYHQGLSRGREWLRVHDPDGFAFVAALYGGTLDPGTPKTVTLSLRPATDEAAAKSLEGRLPSHLTVRNHTAQPLRVIWLDYQGRRDERWPLTGQPLAAPGKELVLTTWATHPFVVTDGEGKALWVVTAGEDDGVVDVPAP